MTALLGPKWDPKPEGSGALPQMAGQCLPGASQQPISMPSRHPPALSLKAVSPEIPESFHTHLDIVLPRLWQPVFGKLGEGVLGRG